jgi:hexosaminidase
LKEQKSNFKQVRGLVLTGWQRYDHFATLCELLPAALPSLVLNLITASSGHFHSKEVWNKFNKVMKCRPLSYFMQHSNGAESTTLSTYLGNDPYLYHRAGNCEFPGLEIFRLTKQLNDVIKRVDAYVYDINIHRAWLTEYNFRRNYSSPARVDEQIPESGSLLSLLEFFVTEAKTELSRVYDKYTTAEWIEQNIYPYILKLKQIQTKSKQIASVREWKSRPLPVLQDLKIFGFEV